MGLAGDIILVIVAALPAGILAKKLGLPLLLGYIVAGILVGPYTLGPVVSDIHDLERLADVGVALLLFSLGLEFPLSKLAPVRRVALIGTPLQMLLVVAGGYGLGRLLGWETTPALWFGALLSLSSTTAVLKTLTERNLLNTLASRVIIGMLIVQDLGVIPLMTLLPALGSPGAGLAQLGTAALRAGLFLAAMLVLGVRLLPLLMERVVAWRSRELFLITVAAVGLGVGYATHLFGLSMAFGAFLAGVILSESSYSHQALADITPLRDILAMFFFVSVGALFDPSSIRTLAPVVVLVVGAVLVGKGLIFAGIVRLFGYSNIVPLAAGLGLFQVGEFSFVLARVGLASGALPRDLYSIFLAVAIVTMALTPFTMGLAPRLYAWWRRRRPEGALDTVRLPRLDLSGHIVVAGYGRVGAFATRLLEHLGETSVVVDLDPRRVVLAEQQGLPVIYGDVSAVPVLEAARFRQAKLVLLTVPNAVTSTMAAAYIRQEAPEVPLVARASGEEHLAQLGRLGVTEAVQPELEAGLEIVRQALVRLGAGNVETQTLADLVRREYYVPMTGETEIGKLLPAARAMSRAVGVDWFTLAEGSPLAGKTIGELKVRAVSGAMIMAVIAGDKVTSNPGPGTVLQAGDTLAVLGTSAQRTAFTRSFGS